MIFCIQINTATFSITTENLQLNGMGHKAACTLDLSLSIDHLDLHEVIANLIELFTVHY